MADEPDEQNSFQSRASTVIQDAAEATAAALAALASGLVLRAQEILALADDNGQTTIPVRSSCISELQYDTVNSTLKIIFHDGSEYDYPDVSMYSFLALANARSVGSHYNQFFRGTSPTHWAGSKKQRIKIGRR